MAKRMRHLTAAFSPGQERGPALSRAFAHTLAQFIVAALIVVMVLALLIQWNTIEVGDGAMPGPALAAGAVAPRAPAPMRALVSRLGAERERPRWRIIQRGRVTRGGLASLLIEINRNSGKVR